MVVELEAAEGKLSGYAKPFLHNIKIINWQQDVVEQKDNPLELIWELSWEVIQNVLTTLGTDELATEIAINGSISRAEIKTWPAFYEAIKNTLLNSVEQQFTIDLETDKEKE